jgi:hypothetical protein
METPPLYRQLMNQLSQWVNAKDVRHLQGVSEAVGAILQSHQASPARWLPYLSHRGCGARAHLERLHYLLENPHISVERFYHPLLENVLAAFAHSSLTLAFDTSVLWNQYCLVEVSLIWGGRSLTVAQTVLEHASASVAFEDYQAVLEMAYGQIPPGCSVTLLADRGFDHKQLLQWLKAHQWEWAIRLKSDVSLRLATGRLAQVDELWPPQNEAYFYQHIEVYDEIEAHLATAHLSTASEPWAVLSSSPVSIKTFELYGQRFGGIEPHFKDYKSSGFELPRSRLRDAAGRFTLLNAKAVIGSLPKRAKRPTCYLSKALQRLGNGRSQPILSVGSQMVNAAMVRPYGGWRVSTSKRKKRIQLMDTARCGVKG